MQQHPEPITISNICGGAIAEVFDRTLKEVLKNITDINTEEGRARGINIQLVFKPKLERCGADVVFTCSSKLAPVVGVKASVFLGKFEGELAAYSADVRQQSLYGNQTKAEPVKPQSVNQQ